MEKIKFQMEIGRVLDILSKEIYDSPYALLRENVQNAYDAILMREQFAQGKWSSTADGLIKIQLQTEEISVIDNGIGMSEKVLKENYWKAGSSGKQTDLAKKAGVIGTFGIGGMANFGVCSKLTIETESIETKERIISEVDREHLSLLEDCISIEKIPPTGVYGTTITVKPDPRVSLDPERAKSYLSQFVRYLPTKVELNGTVISQEAMQEKYRESSPRLERKWVGFERSGIQADVVVQCDYNAIVSTAVNNLSISGEAINGVVFLRQDSGQIWGFRSSFGLAPIPASSFYSFGGIVNLSVLSPTAGREALSRESISLTSRIIELVEECATIALSEIEISNRSNAFMSYLLAKGKIHLAGRLQPRVEPEQEMTLQDLEQYSQKHVINYYDGTDESLIKSLATPDRLLVVLSRSNPRRQVEAQFIQQFCKAEKVIDIPRVLKIYQKTDYEMDELSFVLFAESILEDDYLLQNAEIRFADLTHNLPLLVSSPEQGTVKIDIQRRHSTLEPILRCYRDSRDVFQGFIKDYLRIYVYPQIRSWVPSSTREGADALQKILQKRRELQEIGIDDIGLTSAFSEFLAGRVSFSDVAQKFMVFKNTQTQEIAISNVGNLETEIPDLIQNPIHPPKQEPQQTLQPSPPILRTEVITEKKVLIVDKPSPILNDFKMFLGISERAFKEEYVVFVEPHATRIIWGGHRIILIFTHASSRFSLYYDIELFEDVGGAAGGGTYPTTTIITKNRIFVPIPSNLQKYFEITKEKDVKKFYVRFDVI